MLVEKIYLSITKAKALTRVGGEAGARARALTRTRAVTRALTSSPSRLVAVLHASGPVSWGRIRVKMQNYYLLFCCVNNCPHKNTVNLGQPIINQIFLIINTKIPYFYAGTIFNVTKSRK